MNNMGEVKSVKVDNWGVFFLQKLQNFFNKTDYCDLTLQFNDNSQLKVHRLVLSACTDYFNVLEQTCEVMDDILVMPQGLQADVVVPIVNFMYTGTLEFEITMYGRLLKTARDMNMTVLLKLLEAHKRTVESARTQVVKRPGPKTFASRRPPSFPQTQVKVERSYTSPGTSGHRRVPISSHQYKTLQLKSVSPSTSYYPAITTSEPASIVAKYGHSKTPAKGPSRFDCNDETILPPDSFEQFDAISYESKPLITANQICKEDLEDYDNLIPAHDTSATFEQLRKSYTNNKRPSSSVSSFESPPEKKPNIQDVKEYAEQQLMRKQIAAEYDDDNEYDDVLDDEFHNDDDDEDYIPPVSVQKQIKKPSIVIKKEKDQKPTIVVKDTAGSNVNHAKIISEVLKKYPHLVKNNKNIKLKIMAKSTSSSPSQNIIIKQEPIFDQSVAHAQEIPKSITVNIPRAATMQAFSPTKPIIQRVATTQSVPTTAVKSQSVLTSVSTEEQQKSAISNAPRRIDSKTMHALIAKGAENTTGPWLCLRCGVSGRPISIPSYRGFRRHLINTHKEKVDARLCEHCGWRSLNNQELYHHLKVQHFINPPAGYEFPTCSYCNTISLNKASLDVHIKQEHPDKVNSQQQCMYCDELFQDEDILYNHMHSNHKIRAQKDGLIDYTDDEEDAYFSQLPAGQVSDNKIKIISNIAIPQTNIKPGTKITLEPSSEATALSTVATGIATSLGLIDSSDSQEIQYLEENAYITAGSISNEPRFVNADGHLMDLTPEQREEIMSQLDNQHEGGVVMVLNEEPFETTAEIIAPIEKPADNITALADIGPSSSILVAYSNNDKSKAVKSESEEMDIEGEGKEEHMEWHNDSRSSVEQTSKNKVAADEKEDSAELNNIEEDLTESVDEVIDEKDSKADDKDKKDKDDGDKTNVNLDNAKEKLKLIAGDWSDDEDEPQDDAATKSEENDGKSNENTAEKEKEANEDSIENSEADKEILFETLTEVPGKDDNDNLEMIEHDADDGKETIPIDDSKETEEEEKEVEEKPLPENEEQKTEVKKLDEEEKIEKTDDDKKKQRRLKSEDESSDEKDESKTKVEPEDDSKKNKGGDQIRSLISDWGDDDDDEEEL